MHLFPILQHSSSFFFSSSAGQVTRFTFLTLSNYLSLSLFSFLTLRLAAVWRHGRQSTPLLLLLPLSSHFRIDPSKLKQQQKH